MKSNQITLRFLSLWCLILMSLTWTLSAHAKIEPYTPGSAVPKELSPLAEHEKASRDIARQLQYAHYRNLKIDSKVSEQIFDNYLKYLDPQRVYLTRQDVEEFSKYRKKLDKAVKAGQLEPAFEMYNRFHARIINRLDFALTFIKEDIGDLDFTKDESLELDREEAEWAENEEELDDLWRRRIKNGLLAQRLSGKADKEIHESLYKRYRSQLSRVMQAKPEDAFQAFMNVVTNVYDPHTQYFSPRSSENFNINMSLSLEGIGAVLQSDNEYTKVVRLVPAGPADKHGKLKPADRIVGVGQGEDGDIVDVVGWRLEEVVDLIRGPKKTLVKLEVIPAKSTSETETRLIKIIRDKVDLEDQSAQKNVIELERGGEKRRIGIIDIPTFYADFRAMQKGDPNARSTTRDVRNLISELKGEDINGLVIDLRGNGGGSLQEAIKLTGLFIQEGPTVQVRTADDRVRVYDDPDDSTLYKGPLVVLVNRMSASASEIFAAAIQDYGRGIVLGDQTFGKGTVQSVRGLSHGQLKITEAKFYRISGGSTQHKGVIPDIILPSPLDPTEIGEGSLEEALPWDRIDSVAHRSYGDFDPLLPMLARNHKERMKKNEEYQALLKEIQFLKSSKQNTIVSLHEKKRKDEVAAMRAEELSYVNMRRKAQGESTFSTYQEYEDYQEEQASEPAKEAEIDFIAKEGGEVLLDLLTLSQQVAGGKT